MIGLHCGQTNPSSGQQRPPTDEEINNNNNNNNTLTNHIKLIQQASIIKSELHHHQHQAMEAPSSQQVLQAAAYHHHHGLHRQQVMPSPGYHSAAPSPHSPASSPVSSSSCSSSSHSAGCASPSSSSSVNSSSAPTTTTTTTTPTPSAAATTTSTIASPTINPNSSPSSSGASSMSPRTSPSSPNHLLDYYPAIHQDGLALSWFHEANTQSRLKSALQSSKIVVSGDISLAEMSRYPVPIMARPPVRASDLTLENWLAETTASQKAIKLTFTSTKTVEPAFRVLARYADQLRGPLILSADILAAPEPPTSSSSTNGASKQPPTGSQSQPVDAWTFLMLCRTRFPRCTISIGWCPLSSGPTSVSPPSSTCSSSSTWSSLVASAGERLLDTSSPRSSADSLFELDLLEQAQLGASHAHLQQQLASLHPHLHHRHHHTQHHHQGHLNHHRHHHNHHHHNLGSGASSSGNSSGSPSPTSPLGHLMHPQVAASLQKQLGKQLDGDQQAAAAAAMAAAVMAATSQFHHLGNHTHLHQNNNNNNNMNHHHQQQQPLNLNINEAEVGLDRRLAAPLMMGPAGHLSSCLGGQNSGRHVHKKAALSQPPNNSHLLLKTTAEQPAVGYTRGMIDKMASLVKEYNLTQPVTFAVEARLIKSSSIGELQRLLYQVGGNSTLTVVAQQDDLISVDDLLTIRKAFANNQILFDLPDQLASSLRLRLEGC